MTVHTPTTTSGEPAGDDSGVSTPAAFDLISDHGAEQVVFGADPDTGMRAIIAVHSTVFGPALGGTRFYPYADESAALLDVLRLARGMTYKHAVAGTGMGGGKAVIVGDPRTMRTDELMLAYGRLVDRLGGRYITAEDVGTTMPDMDLVRTVTDHVAGISEALGGSGDPSPATAWGIFAGMKAVAEWLWGDESLEGKHIAIAGVGKVGAALAGHLHDAGARLTVADVNAPAAQAMVDRFGAAVVDYHDVHAVEADIFAPCALGAALNATTIPQLRCAAVCGCANNQLATPEDGERIAATGILYAPDYVVNAGGIINIAAEKPDGYDRQRAFDWVARIQGTTTEVFHLAKDHGVTTAEAADRLAEQRLAAATAAKSRA